MKIQLYIEQLKLYYILDNRLDKVLVFLLILFIGLILKRYFSLYLGRFVYSFVKKFSNDVPVKEFLELLSKPLERLLMVVFIYLSTKNLTYPDFMKNNLEGALGAYRWVANLYEGAFLVSLTWIVLRTLDFGLIVIRNNPEYSKEKINGQLFPFFKEFFKILVIIFSFFFFLGAVFDLDVTSIIAGLGIGGLAVALAGKETLENLIASFTIFLDKPFIVGDLIQVGSINGTVEKVGFRSTRIRTSEKSLLTIPNKQLVDQPLDNQANRTLMRVKTNLLLEHTTTNEIISLFSKRLIDDLQAQEFVEKNVSVKFNEITSTGIDLQCVIYLRTNETEVYYGLKEKCNFIIKGILEEMHIGLEKNTSQFVVKQMNYRS